jgi:glycosyltransferase involved in cell wall biosynthesis
MLLVVTNIPTPYRTAFFDQLQIACQKEGLGFHVLYCKKTEPRRNWPYDPQRMAHSHEVLPGFTPPFKSFYPHVNPSVGRRIRAHAPRFLVLGGAWNTPTIIHSSLVRLKDTKVIFWSEGHADAARFNSGIVGALRRFAYRQYDAFAVPNRKSLDWAKQHSPSVKHFFALPNSVDTQFFARTSTGERDAARFSLGIPPLTRLLVQISGLEPRKGCIELADAFLRCKTSKLTDSMLAIVGEGQLKGELKEKSSESGGKILLPGPVDQSTVRKWLMAADAFLLNTFRDPNPLAPIEAGAAGLPVALSSIAGNFEEFMSSGHTIPIEDPKDPTTALEALLSMETHALRKIGAGLEAYVEKTFAAKYVASSFLEELLNKFPRPA